MEREVDYSVYDRTTEAGELIFPDDCLEVDGYFILPNGKYLPEGCYLLDDGSYILYEPNDYIDDLIR